MIYNLIQYLRDTFPLYTFVQLLDPSDTQATIVVRELGGGSVTGYPMERVDSPVQIISRGQDRFVAKQVIEDIYLELKEKFDFTLPAVLELSLPELTLARIQANQTPGDMSQSGAGVYEYVVNFTVTYSDKTVSA
jgi:hypothetical protein